MDAVILAGGFGTRLASRANGAPKALVPIAGTPLLEHQLRLMRKHGMRRIFVLTGHGAEAINEFCGDGSRWGLRIECIRESRPLGTAGAVMASLSLLPERFFVVYGDVLLDVDLARMASAHLAARADATLFAHPNDHPQDSDLIEVDQDDRIIAIHPYPRPPAAVLQNLVSAGLYVIEKNGLNAADTAAPPLDFGKHVFPELLRRGAHLHAYRSPEYIKDVGTPERLDRAISDVTRSPAARASLSDPRPAIFLDRDGTLNEHVGHLSAAADLTLLPGIPEALRVLRRAAYRLVIITNQPVVSRGQCSERQLKHIHNKLETELSKQGAFVDAIYYCPHHPDKGFAGEVPELKIACDCRKPNSGLIDNAARSLNIDLRRSWMIGDSTVDIETARRAKLRSILLGTGMKGEDGRFPCRPDFTFASLRAAADFIADEFTTLAHRVASIAARVGEGSVVLIGGQARSGKSTLAKVLEMAFREQGRDAVVVSLDAWIRNAEDRGQNPGFHDRHDMASAAAAIETMRASPGRYQISRYHRARRAQVDDGALCEISSATILIVEGVTALVNPALISLAALRVSVVCPEETRRERMRASYLACGFSAHSIEQILVSRAIDEVPAVDQGRNGADLELDLGRIVRSGPTFL